MKPGTVGALTGIAAAHAHLGRITDDEAIAKIREVLGWATSGAADRQCALDEAASVYVLQSFHQPWSPVALQLLIQAGANRDEALRSRASVPGSLGGLGEQASPKRR